MILTFYIPIYSWGPNPDERQGASLGSTHYDSLNDLYGFEYDHENKKSLVVGHMEVSGNFPTQNIFEAGKNEQK